MVRWCSRGSGDCAVRDFVVMVGRTEVGVDTKIGERVAVEYEEWRRAALRMYGTGLVWWKTRSDSGMQVGVGSVRVWQRVVCIGRLQNGTRKEAVGIKVCCCSILQDESALASR